MIKLGNISTYRNGKYIKPVQWKLALRSAILMLVPGILLIVPTSFVLAPIWLEIPLYIIVGVLLIISLVVMTLATIVDPGIIPGRELQEYYLNKLYEVITNKQKALYSGK